MGFIKIWLERWFSMVIAVSSTAKPNFKQGFQVNGSDYTATELNTALGGGNPGTAGTVTASKAVIVDANKDISTFRNLTATNLISAGTYTGGLTTGITAFAGGGQSSATQLTTEFNNVTVCATAGDSVKLPAAAAGLRCVVRNSGGAGSLAIFPASGDAIDSLSANASISIFSGATISFWAIDGTTWYSSIARVASSTLDVGADAVAGSVNLYPSTTTRGRVNITATSNTGNTVTSVVFGAQAAARTLTIPDASTSASTDTNWQFAMMRLGSGAPSGFAAAQGSLYVDTANGKLYVCTTASATSATFALVGTQA